jgi:hypothetical protein
VPVPAVFGRTDIEQAGDILKLPFLVWH